MDEHIKSNLGVHRADKRAILSQASTGHIQGNDSSWFWYRHDRVSEAQRAVISAYSQLDAAGIGPKEGSTFHAC